MAMLLPTVLLTLSGLSTAVLGTIVLVRNPHRRTHRAFGVLALNLALWTAGVACIVNGHTEERVRLWLSVTFMFASFLSATFYHFIALFPGNRFVGSRVLLAGLYVTGFVLSVAAFSPLQRYDITIFADRPPIVEAGPLLSVLGVSIGLAFVCALMNMVAKLVTAVGVERRQIQHVLLGIFASMSLAIVTNILAPLLGVGSMEPYGPSFSLLMVAIFAYAMVRYHLLDIWFIIGRTTVYAFVTTFVAVTFLGSVSLMHWIVQSMSRGRAPEEETAARVFTTLLAALVIALVIQPLKERAQLIVDRVVLKRRYDMNRLMARISHETSHMVRLDELLEKVAKDIQATVGANPVRVLLLDEHDPKALIVEYSSEAALRGRTLHGYEAVIHYAQRHPDPLVTEELLHAQPTAEEAEIARLLAQMDASLCIPLTLLSGLIGFVTLGQKASRDIYTQDDLVVFGTLAAPLATAIENARLYRALQDANLHRARILSHMRGGVITIDNAACVSLVNRSAIDYFGPIEIGQKITSLEGDVFRLLERSLTERREFHDFESIVQQPSGEKLHMAISTSPLATPDDEVTGAMAMIYDLTQVKRLEQNVQRADRLSSIGTLAAGMAHEIKNPLVSIKTFAQLLSKRYDDPEFRNTFVDIVPHEVERIDSIVTRLLDFARPRPTSFATHDLRAIILKTTALIENQTRGAQIEVVTRFPDEPVEIYGDSQQLHQVFLNLALNAIDAMKVSPLKQLEIHVRFDCAQVHGRGAILLREVDCARVAVRDTGCGIPENDQKNLFTPFFTTKENGSGLGLAVVHGILVEHDGEVDVRSRVGKGSTFTVTLPLSRSASLLKGS